MNYWTERSIELANKENYLDELYNIYPMAKNEERVIDETIEAAIIRAIEDENDYKLINYLFTQDLFPIKDSYVAFLKRDRSAIERNPNIVKRITSSIYELGAEEVLKRIKSPKETNRQMGPLFNNWLLKGSLGISLTEDELVLLNSYEDYIFIGSDQVKADFARKYLGYNRDKGLDFLAKINGFFVMGEAKFLTDFGGHQNAQFDDALSTMRSKLEETPYKVKLISILDGVLYIKSKNKMYTRLQNDLCDNEVVLSALLLRSFIEDIQEVNGISI